MTRHGCIDIDIGMLGQCVIADHTCTQFHADSSGSNNFFLLHKSESSVEHNSQAALKSAENTLFTTHVFHKIGVLPKNI